MSVDLVTRLKLDDKQFNDNIRQSKRELETFKQVGNAVTSALKTFTIALVGIESASQLFNRYINSNRDSQLQWQSTMDGARISVDNFFTAIQTGDWSVFEDGIMNAIGLAKDYIKYLELAKQAGQMGKTKAERLEGQRNNYEYLITSEHTSKTEKQNAFTKYAELTEAEIEEREKTNEYLFKSLESAFKVQNVKSIKNAKEMQDAIDKYLDPKTSEYAALEEYKERIDEANAAKSLGQKLMSDNVTYAQGYEMYEKAIKKIANVNNEYLNEMRRFQNMFKGEESNALRETLDQINDNIDKIGTAKKDLDDAKIDLEKAMTATTSNTLGGKSTTVKVKAEFDEGSLGYLEKQIQAKQLEFKYATDINSRNKIQKEIDELTKQKRYIELEYKLTQPLQQSNVSFSSMVNLPDMSKLPKIENPIKKEDINLNNQYVESLNAISSVMGSVSNMTSEGAAAWLSWAANVITAVAQAIPAITTLIAAKTAEGAASAGAEAAKTPLVGWLLVGAAIASALAAFATIPTFADGGIFQSPFTSGDKNLARLNGGEMILNKGQQANLFNLLDKGTTLGGGNVTFKIQGKELVGVLNNYNNKRSKVL